MISKFLLSSRVGADAGAEPAVTSRSAKCVPCCVISHQQKVPILADSECAHCTTRTIAHRTTSNRSPHSTFLLTASVLALAKTVPLAHYCVSLFLKTVAT